jgi:hypothetical protein
MKKLTLLLALFAFTLTAVSYAGDCPNCPSKKEKKDDKDKDDKKDEKKP